MIKEIFLGTASTLKPKNKTSFLWFCMFPILAAAFLLSKRTHIRTPNGKETDMYVFGKKGNPKTVFITNQNPRRALKNASKNYLNSNFKD